MRTGRRGWVILSEGRMVLHLRGCRHLISVSVLHSGHAVLLVLSRCSSARPRRT